MQARSESPRARIAIVDDDALFAESVTRNLSDAGYATVSFADGASALNALEHNHDIDMVLLDWKMPNMTGIELLQHLRQRGIEIPVIFLTVLSDQVYEEAGLLGGAVDFIEKSRNFSILLRRIELILGGAKGSDSKKVGVVTRGRLTLDHDSKRATWNGVQLGLTLTEFRIVVLLADNAGRDISYREIYDIVHGEGFLAGDGDIGFRTNVRAFIKRIRQKFRDADDSFSAIHNYPSFGYRWHDDAA